MRWSSWVTNDGFGLWHCLTILLIFLLYCFQDFYLDLTEDNRKITPRDYLELALRPVQGSGKDIASKNEVLFVLFQFSVIA